MHEMRMIRLVLCICLLGAVGLSAVPARGADVEVYAEGAYTDSDLKVYLYADITTVSLKSFGVKLTYDPTKLTVSSAQKNVAVWYLGTAGAKEPYMNPDTDTPGQVVFVGGLLDTSFPLAGKTGSRVLLGDVVFSRLSSASPGASPEAYFGTTVALGRGGAYSNFVSDGGVVLDDEVGFTAKGVEICERGDANADSSINVQDMAAVKYYMTNGGVVSPWKDCNGDGVINVQDMACVKYAMTH